MQRHKSKPSDDQLVRDENADAVERSSALFRLAVDGFFEFEPLAVELLHHSSNMLRAEAIKILVGLWRKPEYVDDAVQLLHHDPDEMVRGDAAFALSQYAVRTGDQQESITHELANQLTQDSDFGVHEQCYRGLLSLLSPEKSHANLPTFFDRERDVDWSLLKPYLNESQIPQGQLTR